MPSILLLLSISWLLALISVGMILFYIIQKPYCVIFNYSVLLGLLLSNLLLVSLSLPLHLLAQLLSHN